VDGKAPIEVVATMKSAGKSVQCRARYNPSKIVVLVYVFAFSCFGISAATFAQDETAGMVGPVWRWEQTLDSEGKKVVPADPKSYTVKFLEDGTLAVKADCNSKGGIYAIKGDNLSITITHSTLAACPEGSLEDRFVHDLTGGAARVVLVPDARALDLHYGSWTMKFSNR